MTPEEKGNIAVFESSKGSVVYISTSEQVLDAWTLRVQTVPHGTGSGFIVVPELIAKGYYASPSSVYRRTRP